MSLNNIHGGTISEETATLIKQMEAEAGGGEDIYYTMGCADDAPFTPLFEVGGPVLVTTNIKEAVFRVFEATEGKELNEYLYELFTNGAFNLYVVNDDDENFSAHRVEFRSIDEDGLITVYIDDAPVESYIPVRDEYTEVYTEAFYMNNNEVIPFVVLKNANEHS